MNDSEQIALIRIVKNVKSYLESYDIRSLRRISNSVVKDASVMQNDYTISLAIIIYTLSKILEKEHLEDNKGWNSFYKSINKDLDNMLKNLEDSDFSNYSKNIGHILQEIKKFDMKASLYIEELIKSSRIKKGSNMYSYGLSLGRAASLLGISKWELMGYLGNMELSNEQIKPKNPVDRYNTARRIFNLK